MYMAMVRQSDMRHTPDVRTRAIFPEWACEIELGYVATLFKPNQITNLGFAAGQIIGVGDWRQEKGGSNGKWIFVPEHDERYQRIIKTQGRKAQMEAYEKPECYDADTEELFGWFMQETARREKAVPSSMRLDG